MIKAQERIERRARYTVFQLLFWSLLLASAFAFYGLRMPGADYSINLSLFDPMAVLLFAAATWRYGLPSFPTRFVAVAILALTLVASHSLLLAVYDPSLSRAWLLRGTVKLIVIIGLFTCLVFLLRGELGRHIPSPVPSFLLALGVIHSLTWHYLDPAFTPNTLLAANNWLIYFLVLWGQKWPFSITRLTINLAIIAALSVLSLILLSKVGAIIGGLIFGSLVVCYFSEEKRLSVLIWTLPLIAAAIVAVYVLGEMTEIFHRLDSVAKSFSARISLWTVALKGIAESFPFGIGLDQFATYAAQNPDIYRSQHKFPHSVPLGLLVELGLLGLILLLLMSAVVWRATKGFPWHIRPVFLAILIPLALLHDIQGARLLIFIIAFGYAAWSIKAQHDRLRSV